MMTRIGCVPSRIARGDDKGLGQTFFEMNDAAVCKKVVKVGGRFDGSVIIIIS